MNTYILPIVMAAIGIPMTLSTLGWVTHDRKLFTRYKNDQPLLDKPRRKFQAYALIAYFIFDICLFFTGWEVILLGIGASLFVWFCAFVKKPYSDLAHTSITGAPDPD